MLTILIHFGYLSYDEENETVRIPNREILTEYEDIVRVIRYPSTMERVKESDELILPIRKNHRGVGVMPWMVPVTVKKLLRKYYSA